MSKMKKIDIITLYGNCNFGNKLQNYALQFFLQKEFKDFKVNTINTYDGRFINIVKSIMKGKEGINERERAFLKFNKNINYEEKPINIFSKTIKIESDYLIFGSDQVWNTQFEGKSKLFCGCFKSKAAKLSYAASFGIEDVGKKYKKMYRRGLNTFKFISVRENRGREIVKELTGRQDVEVLIDPTMLLDANDWDIISKQPEKYHILCGKKYILNYFLGDVSIKIKKQIEKIANENDCEIINILDKNDPFYNSGPSEFLYLEKEAFLICTDSFHSSVFAMIYNRPFIVFERKQIGIEDMNSRIDTLIDKFKLKGRSYNGNNITGENLQYDYRESYRILEKEREKSKNFLKKALDIV